MPSVVNYSEDMDILAFNVIADSIRKASGMNPTHTLTAIADPRRQCLFGEPVDRSVYFRCKVRTQTLALVFIPLGRLNDV